MSLITVRLYNSIDKQEELIINSDHIVSVQAANDNSANIQMTSGPVFRTTESVAELARLISGRVEGHPALQLEYKKAEPGTDTEEGKTETPAEKKARLKAEAEANKTE